MVHPNNALVMTEVRLAFRQLFDLEQAATLARSRNQEERFVAKESAPKIPKARKQLAGWLQVAHKLFGPDAGLRLAAETAATAPILELWRAYATAADDNGGGK